MEWEPVFNIAELPAGDACQVVEALVAYLGVVVECRFWEDTYSYEYRIVKE